MALNGSTRDGLPRQIVSTLKIFVNAQWITNNA
jgi:hypothetical protein